MITHSISPIYNKDSKVLILGSLPSVKSREVQFFYAHPQNRFWKVIAKVFGEDIPETIEEKTQILLRNNIAVWDVIKSCDIVGSSDSSIKNVVENDIEPILEESNIQHIYINGKKAYDLYNKYIKTKIGIEAVCLPSTSPANATWNLDRLVEAWKVIKE